MNPQDHNPDTNPAWRPLAGRRIYACGQCGTEKEISTNHTGTVWNERCAGSCRHITNPHTAHERVSPYHGPHRYVREYGAPEVTSREVLSMGDPSRPGELLTMGDGSRWFHPYSGGAPVRL